MITVQVPAMLHRPKPRALRPPPDKAEIRRRNFVKTEQFPYTTSLGWTLDSGNYHGALKNWTELQYQYDCYFFIADYHAREGHGSKF